MFGKVLVANRGAAAARVIRALNQLGIRAAAVYSEADREAPYLAEASEALPIGPGPARASYLDQDAVIAAARACRAEAVHPGYGFLSENPDFARRLEAAGIAFIGPAARWLEAMGHKTRARGLMAQHGLPVGTGSELLPPDRDGILATAERIGFPVLIKPAAGGGGIGMIPAHDGAQLVAAAERARALAQRSFGNDAIYIERLLERPRHIEFQVLADRHGNVRHLFERDCSVQRRHQKVIEEAPAPMLPRAPLEALADQVAAVLGRIGYDNIGTVETLRGPDGEHQFIEMNTRLQVEHAVTEAVTGIDLVAAQIRVAAGARLETVLPAAIRIDGHAIEARVYAEDPERFLPSPGKLAVFRPPSMAGIRVETGYAEGNEVTPFYDPMVAKVIAHGADRAAAITRLAEALDAFEVRGIKTNIPALLRVLGSHEFAGGEVDTGLIARLAARRAA